MNVFRRNITNFFLIFVLSHLIIWTVVPTLTNQQAIEQGYFVSGSSIYDDEGID